MNRERFDDRHRCEMYSTVLGAQEMLEVQPPRGALLFSLGIFVFFGEAQTIFFNLS